MPPPQNSYSQGFNFFESAAAGSAFQGENPTATFRSLSVDIRQRKPHSLLLRWQFYAGKDLP
jgi:hypothetical protein